MEDNFVNESNDAQSENVSVPNELRMSQEVPESAQYQENEKSEVDTSGITAEEKHLWYLQEDVLGKGQKPEWFKESKYKTIADQAKAYAEVEKKLGGFTGSPEAYEIPQLENGLELTAEDPGLQEFMQVAKEVNMSQDTFNRLTNLYAKNIQSTMPNLEAEYKKLGENADKKIEVVSNWAKTVLSDVEYTSFENSLVSADMVNMLLKLKGSTIEPSIPGASATPPQPAISRAKISELMADPRYMEDKNYRNEVRSLIEKYADKH